MRGRPSAARWRAGVLIYRSFQEAASIIHHLSLERAVGFREPWATSRAVGVVGGKGKRKGGKEGEREREVEEVFYLTKIMSQITIPGKDQKSAYLPRAVKRENHKSM